MPENRKKLGLDDAYAVQTPDDNRALYRDWAQTYETDFAQARGYVYHQAVAGVYARDQRNLGPVLDVGCGTGMAGSELVAMGFPTVDGIDLSPEMLAQARAKETYRSLTEVDVTKPLPLPDAEYDGVMSVGTFTHGHLGPEPIGELVRVARPNALFALGVNAEHFEAKAFGAYLDVLVGAGCITQPEFERVRMYAAADDEHADDRALVTTFRVL